MEDYGLTAEMSEWSLIDDLRAISSRHRAESSRAHIFAPVASAGAPANTSVGVADASGGSADAAATDADAAATAAAGLWARRPETSLDYNDERNIEEDANLVKHIKAARAASLEQERIAARALTVNEIADADTAARQAMSSVVLLLNEHRAATQCVCDETLLQGANLVLLLAGGRPHGFPPELPEQLTHLSAKLKAAGQEFQRVVDGLAPLERALIVARRATEKAADGARRALAAAP
jgi:hypothetical protein